MPDLTETPYTTAQGAVNAAHDHMAAVRKRHEEEMEAAQAEINIAVENLNHLKAGTSPEVRLLAEHVIAVRGPNNCGVGEGNSALQDAIRDLLNGAEILRDRYIGTKTYEGFVGQRADHEYRFGPKHGRIIFAIELQPVVRQRLGEGGELTPEEIEAAVQYLTNLPRFVENGGRPETRPQDVAL